MLVLKLEFADNDTSTTDGDDTSRSVLPRSRWQEARFLKPTLIIQYEQQLGLCNITHAKMNPLGQ
jgi:hypothetical protein